MQKLLVGLVAIVLAGLAIVSVRPAFDRPVNWTPDGLYYQARLLQIRGESHDAAYSETFRGPLSASLRAKDPTKTGNARWVKYNEPFYQRRVAVPLAGAALYSLTKNRSLLDISLAGYVAAILALFGLLLLRFRLWIAAGVTAATILLQPLVTNSKVPLTDSWGLALEIAALAAAMIVLQRGLRWLPLWIGAIVLLAFTRDSTWIPVLAAGWLAVRYRTRIPVTLFLTGLAAALPALVMYKAPVRDLLALLVNNSQPSANTSWGFIASHYPRAVVDLVRANVGFLRRGEWYTAFYLVGGVVALLALVWRKRVTGPWANLMTAGAVLAFVYVLAAPVFSAFRLELVFVPMAAFGLALTSELALTRLSERGALDRLAVRVPAWARRG
jgi:hypothetical protein